MCMWTWGVWITFFVVIDNSGHTIHLVWWLILTSVSIWYCYRYCLTCRLSYFATHDYTCFDDTSPTCGRLFYRIQNRIQAAFSTWQYLLYWPQEWLVKTIIVLILNHSYHAKLYTFYFMCIMPFCVYIFLLMVHVCAYNITYGNI